MAITALCKYVNAHAGGCEKFPGQKRRESIDGGAGLDRHVAIPRRPKQKCSGRSPSCSWSDVHMVKKQTPAAVHLRRM